MCRRLPAEWEPTDAVIMAWPHIDTDWNYILKDAETCFTAIAEAIAPHARVLVIGPDLERIKFCLRRIPEERLIIVPMETNDTWTRDYGAITVFENGQSIPLDFKFNGWGLKFAADLDNLATSKLYELGIFKNSPENHLNFVLEGGSVESDGNGTILTTDSCLLSANRNGGMSRAQILEYIKGAFGAKQVFSLANGELKGDDTDGHIDTLARFAPGNLIFYTGCVDPSDEHHRSLKAMEQELQELRTPDGTPYKLVELPLPDAMYDPEDGMRLPATYANFLYVNGAVLVPAYGSPLKDKLAVDIISKALPEYEVISIDCSVLVRQHGSLHCSTMQLPNNTLAI